MKRKGKLKVGKINFSKGQDRIVWFNPNTRRFECQKYSVEEKRSKLHQFGSWDEVIWTVAEEGWDFV